MVEEGTTFFWQLVVAMIVTALLPRSIPGGGALFSSSPDCSS